MREQVIDYGTNLEFVFRHSTKVVFGINAIRELVAELEELTVRKVLLVTDDGIIKCGLAGKAQAVLGDRCVAVFNDVPPDSSVATIRNGVTLAREKKADSVVMLGGGSVMDTGKCIAVLLKTGGNDIRDHVSINQLKEPVTPMIAIPTTAGTGSEVSYGAVVKDSERGVKMVFADIYLSPNTAILDPKMTEGLAPYLTAATGLDALTHHIEAFVSSQANPFTDAIALHGIRLIAKYLPRCVERGDDLDARSQVLIAACMGAIAFNNAILGLTHAMAHALGARFNVHHGTANALFLPYVIRFNMDGVPERYALVAEALGVDTKTMSTMDAAQAAATAVWNLTRKLGLPQRLMELNIPEDELSALSQTAMADACLMTNPKPISDLSQILAIYKQAY